MTCFFDTRKCTLILRIYCAFIAHLTRFRDTQPEFWPTRPILHQIHNTSLDTVTLFFGVDVPHRFIWRPVCKISGTRSHHGPRGTTWIPTRAPRVPTASHTEIRSFLTSGQLAKSQRPSLGKIIDRGGGRGSDYFPGHLHHITDPDPKLAMCTQKPLLSPILCRHAHFGCSRDATSRIFHSHELQNPDLG